MHQTLAKMAGDGFTFCTFSANSTKILPSFLSLLAFYHSVPSKIFLMVDAMNFKYSDFSPSRLRYRHKWYRHDCYRKFWIHNNVKCLVKFLQNINLKLGVKLFSRARFCIKNYLDLLNANPTKWSNTLKQFIDCCDVILNHAKRVMLNCSNHWDWSRINPGKI